MRKMHQHLAFFCASFGTALLFFAFVAAAPSIAQTLDPNPPGSGQPTTDVNYLTGCESCSGVCDDNDVFNGCKNDYCTNCDCSCGYFEAGRISPYEDCACTT